MRDTKQDILHFWFVETQPVQWFQKNEDFDRLIRERFLVTYRMAQGGLCDGWAAEAEGALALCIALDQFPRNMFRKQAEAFATDAHALRIAAQAVRMGFDKMLPPLRRRFLYLPFEHSEDPEDQKRSVSLFAGVKDADPLGYEYALRHQDVISRFGRFPQRNKALGRDSTGEEILYLSQPGAEF
ncbi:MAG: DUF924 domain-containing protein [Micavibrio aeruginosavorus]|nr:DUF924 domain-containing protein [Micavibrio aeruginosavorus]